MSKRTPIYEEHKKLGGKIIDFAGWEMPVQYTGIADEHKAVREFTGLFDVSHMGTFEISGKDAAEFLDYLTPSDISKSADGKATYSLLLKENGTIIDDIIIYRFSEKKFYMVVNASNLEKDFGWIKKHLKGEVNLTDRSKDFTLLAIQGPKTAAILSKVTNTDLSTIKKFHLAEINIKGVGTATLARTGYTGEDGFEMFVTADKATKLWNTLIEIGKDDGLKPIGLAARDTLRLEMKYALYGHELSEDTNALEAGLRWIIKFKKSSDFIGKEALKKIRSEGVKRKLVGFKMVERAIPRHGYAIVCDKRTVGRVTSGTFSPSLGEPIGIGYVEAGLAGLGTKFSIDIRGKERLAEVVETPFYKKKS
jgi:aminomethyltransferase